MNLEDFILRDKNSLSGLFFTAAIDARRSAEEAFKEEEFHREQWNKSKRDHALVGWVASARERQAAVAQTVLFCAFCLEATVNAVIDDKLTNFYVNGFGRLEPTVKWVTAIKFAYGKELLPSNVIVGQIGKLFERRNVLAHPKPRFVPSLKRNVKPLEPVLPIQWASESIKTATDAFRFLQDIDPDLEELANVRAERNMYLDPNFSSLLERACLTYDKDEVLKSEYAERLKKSLRETDDE